MMSFYVQMRAVLRIFLFLFLIGIYFLHAIFLYITEFDPIKRRKKLVENCHSYAGLFLKAFQVEILCPNLFPADENSLLVGNHLGFIDIVCLQTLRSSVFITSLEMKHTPFLGQITDLAGCAYVNRKNRMNIQDELQGVTEVLKQGFRVVLYAESVASNGEQVLPFKKTLLLSAGFAQKPIRPFVFNYRKVNNGPVLFKHRDSLCWHDSESFGAVMWKALQLDSVVCEIEFLPLVHPVADEDRTALAKNLHDMVSNKFIPFKPDMNLQASAPYSESSSSSNKISHSL